MKKNQTVWPFLTPSIKEDSFPVLQDQRGIFAMLTAIALVVIFGFLILGFEVGKWYIVRAELSKTVDAASLLAATHQGNSSLDEFFGVEEGEGLQELVRAAGEANFHEGWFGAEAPNLILVSGEDGTFRVDAETDVANQFAGIFDKPETTIGSTGTAQKRDVEIMLVLDRSTSMRDDPHDEDKKYFSDLKRAAQNFVRYFQDTEETDKMGLLSFNKFVRQELPLGTNFFTDGELIEKIEGLSIEERGTNIEDALDQAGSKFTEDDDIRKYIIFFSDGAPRPFGRMRQMGHIGHLHGMVATRRGRVIRS